uniref:Uncharacterized protein n=1 Tax=Caenorhabditis japonica TaxID=281687 RepID=A0A8R1IG73_CAEJA
MLVSGAKKIPFCVEASLFYWERIGKDAKQMAVFSLTFTVEGSFRVRPQITPAPGQNALLSEDMFATPVAFSVSTKF